MYSLSRCQDIHFRVSVHNLFFYADAITIKVMLFTVQLIISVIFVACCRAKFRILIINVFLRDVKF